MQSRTDFETNKIIRNIAGDWSVYKQHFNVENYLDLIQYLTHLFKHLGNLLQQAV